MTQPMTSPSRIADLFLTDVTRDIAPVVYFHEQTPARLAAEVSEYIVTGGWPEDHPHHRRVPSGIHEQYVRLLTNIAAELDKPGGPDLPTVWISGFYGSGKSSFAKLLGLALDGVVTLPDGTTLSEAWLRRDTSERASELRDAWRLLRQKVNPIAVVFDIGATARDNEHLHAVALRQVQKRLGYCSVEPLVADFELRLERDGEWARFQAAALQTLGRPWAEVKDKQLAEEDFSTVLSVLYPERYTDPMKWLTSRGGTELRATSPAEAVEAIADMLRIRRPDATLFLVIDEVSQYVLSQNDRVERLRAFAEQLGARLKGRAWLMALGQQKLDEDADASFLIKTKDRFPPRLRVHLANTNIRDVVHKRLLQKRPEVENELRALFERHRPELKLHAYRCESVTPDDFIEVYPMLPEQLDLILQLTSAMRLRSSRAQGDDQAIRGLLQLLGELFRSQDLASRPVGTLVTLDQIYDVQHTALNSDVQDSMSRVLSQCADDASGLLVQVAKVVALLELIQETVPTDARLVAQCLYDRVDRGNRQAAIDLALEDLRRRNLLSYSEKQGYRLQSSAGEEWERDRRDMHAPPDALIEIVQASLTFLLELPDRPKLQGRPFPWHGLLSDGRRLDDLTLVDSRDEATVEIDFRYLGRDERAHDLWVKRSGETALDARLVWVVGDTDQVRDLASELTKSRAMVKKYGPRADSLLQAKRLLLQQEQSRAEDLESRARDAVAAAFMNGRLYFRGRPIAPSEHGTSFATTLNAVANRVLPDLYPHFVATQLRPAELLQLLAPDLSGLSTSLVTGELGIFELDAGKYVPTCGGVVPRRVQEFIEAEHGVSGTGLLAHFNGPPYGYTASVVKACVAGLLRAGKLRITPEAGTVITAVRDVGVRDLFEKDRAFRRASVEPSGDDDVGFQARARICRFFKDRLELSLERDDNTIADEVSRQFPVQLRRLRDVHSRFNQLPGAPRGPDVLTRLGVALEKCLERCRETRPTVHAVKKHLDDLSDGLALLALVEPELTPAAIAAVRRAHDHVHHHTAQLAAVGPLPSDVDAAAKRITAHLASERPWRDLAALDPDLQTIERSYIAERTRRLAWQEKHVEATRVRIKGVEGFSTLTADSSHRVLRPLAEAATVTSEGALAPTLTALDGPFLVVLKKAEDEARDLLDELTDPERLAVRVEHRLTNRVIATEQDVEAVVNDLRKRLLGQLKTGARVRLV